MIKLKKIFHSKFIFIVLISLTIINCIYKTCIKKYKSVYSNETELNVLISKIEINDKYLMLDVIGKEKLKAIYYFKNNNEKNVVLEKLMLGDRVLIKGRLERPSNNTNFNQFNYKQYLYNNKIYYIFNIESIYLVEGNKKLTYNIKNFVSERIEKYDAKVSSYLKAFILGDTSSIDSSIKENYRILGISHLLSTSGMHISLFTGILMFLLKKINMKEFIRYLIIFVFLLFYMFLTGFTPSILRSGVCFIFNSINKLLKLDVESINVFIFAISIIIFINPFIVYNMGFIFSSVTSFYLICFMSIINKSSGIRKSIIISFIANLATFPLVIYNYFEINLLGVIYNIFFIPIISLVIFPLSLISFVIFPISKVLLLFINVVEYIMNCLVKIDSVLILSKPSVLLIVIYYIVITIVLYCLNKNKKRAIFLFIILVFIHYNKNMIFKSTYLLALDVGQGDSFLFHSNNNTFLVDTGGSFYDDNNVNSTKVSNVLKSLGIRKIDYIFITHGDIDHIGYCRSLLDDFRIGKVYFNMNEYNNNELSLQKFLKKHEIKYEKIGEAKFMMGKFFVQALSIDFDNENDSSIMLAINVERLKLLFMGDCGKIAENYLLKNAVLGKVDILKVGHHGSKTSSSKEFINEINPKYSIISVGKNNRYGHPNKEVLENLENSKIYRTDQDGSIIFKIKNNKLRIETYSP